MQEAVARRVAASLIINYCNLIRKMKTIYLAGGCFWGMQHFMQQIYGVGATRVGYANSVVENPDYKLVCTGTTDAAETVEVGYDPDKISLFRLLQLFFMAIDPTTLNRQGGDIGTQYRSGIYYVDAEDLPVIEKAIDYERGEVRDPVVTEVGRLVNFYPAEEYHQDYLDKNPSGYCHIDPALFKLAREANAPGKVDKESYEKPDDRELRERLTPLQYAVARENLTERPFLNEYNAEFRPGIYVDIVTGEPLFLSTDKFESGCGWPAFSRPIDKSLLDEHRDLTHGMDRTEVRSRKGDTHLGHVFDDGPKELGGIRYCINSASLRFVPLEDMEKQGYADLIPLLSR